MRVLVTGSRLWPDKHAVWEALDELRVLSPDGLTVVHGDCPNGADAFARAWCGVHVDVTEERHPADWDQHGKRAGFIRNAEMVALGADACIAFIYRESAGATHTATLAERAGIQTVYQRV